MPSSPPTISLSTSNLSAGEPRSKPSAMPGRKTQYPSPSTRTTSFRDHTPRQGESLQSPLSAEMCSHYLGDPVACTPAAGWEKGQVENQAGNARERLFTPRLHVAGSAELNAWLEARCLAQARASAHPEQSDK